MPRLGQPRRSREALGSLDQRAEKAETPLLAVVHDVEPGPLLERQRFVDGAILDAFELGPRHLASAMRAPCVPQPRRPQQRTDRLRTVYIACHRTLFLSEFVSFCFP